MDKKNTMLLTVIAVATLLVAVVGATFAYFNVYNETTAGTSAVNANVQNVGLVSLTGGETLNLTVTAADMAKDKVGSTYNATTAQGATVAKVATASLTGGDAGVVYNCEFKLAVTNTGNMTGLKATDGGVNVTFAPGVTVAPETGFVAGTNISPDAVKADTYTFRFSMTRNAETTQVVDLVTVGASILNSETDGDQASRLAGKNIGLGFTVSDFRCDTAAL